jgi:predicted alpha/beta superfamily hydrolase
VTLKADAHPVTLPRSEVRTIRSIDDDHEYRLLIASPSETPPAEGFPVIYVLDANASFCTIVEAIRMRCHRPQTTGVVPAIVAGIAHATDGPYDRDRRAHDFSADGAGAFTALLDRATSEVERDYPIDPNRRAIFGHSLGGSFVLDVLLDRLEAYQTYIAVSPSLWSNWATVLDRVDRLVARVNSERLERRVVLSVGEFEERLAPWELDIPQADEIARRRADRQMVSRGRALAERLRTSPGLDVHFDEIASEDHASVVLVAISRALRVALRARASGRSRT